MVRSKCLQQQSFGTRVVNNTIGLEKKQNSLPSWKKNRPNDDFAHTKSWIIQFDTQYSYGYTQEKSRLWKCERRELRRNYLHIFQSSTRYLGVRRTQRYYQKFNGKSIWLHWSRQTLSNITNVKRQTTTTTTRAWTKNMYGYSVWTHALACTSKYNISMRRNENKNNTLTIAITITNVITAGVPRGEHIYSMEYAFDSIEPHRLNGEGQRNVRMHEFYDKAIIIRPPEHHRRGFGSRQCAGEEILIIKLAEWINHRVAGPR